MTSEKMLKLAKNRLKTIILAGLLLGAASFLALVLMQKNFRANSDLLVVQNQQGFSDYYALSKSADYLTGVLTESIYSEKFLEEVNNTNIVTSSFLPSDQISRLKTWEKIIRVSKNPSVGIVSIEVFGDSQTQVAEISNAILSVLTTKNYLFLGKGQNLDIRVLSGPIVEKNPTIANIILASGSGLVLGMLLALLWIYFRSEKNQAKISLKNSNLLSEEEKQRLEYWSRQINGNLEK